MPPAATLGSQTSHGSKPLSPGPGSPNVLIGGLPAWRVLVDVHTCPVVDGVKPHVGGMVQVGAKSVLINNFPAARMGDSVVEIGPPNPIVSGVITVLIEQKNN
ncbi:MAG: PAAR domain-containing protein [Thermoproteota archaeon]|nr:PAAR domain-containing protein [Thermoproteota archaeon]